MKVTLCYIIFLNRLCVCSVLTLSCIPLSATPWTTTRRAPLSMGILQARILEWLPCPPPGDLPNPGIKPRYDAQEADSLLSEPAGKPKNTGVGSLSLLQGNLPYPEIKPGSPIYQNLNYTLIKVWNCHDFLFYPSFIKKQLPCNIVCHDFHFNWNGTFI